VTRGIEIVVEKELNIKSGMPMVTIREFDEHRIKSGKKGRAIIKTMDRGRRFMEEKYVIKDTIYAKVMNNIFV